MPRSFGDRYSNGSYRVQSGAVLPLDFCSSLGDAGFGPSAPLILPTELGLCVSRRGCVSLHGPELVPEVWRIEHEGWCGIGPRDDESLVVGPIGHEVRKVSLATGATLEAVRIGDSLPGVAAVVAEGVIVRLDDWVFRSVTWDGATAWQRRIKGRVVAEHSGLLFFVEDQGRRASCVAIESGETVWSWAPAGAVKAGARICTGFPGLVALDSGVLVRLWDGRMFLLGVSDGREIIAGHEREAGAFLVDSSSVFFKHPFGLVEFDYTQMREVRRIDYRIDVEPLYGGNAPTVNAFCLTEESVIWTTMHGVLMGVSRRPGPDGKRVTWKYEVPGAIMPIAEPPVAWGDYLYFTKKGENPELLCFKSLAAAE